MMYPLSFQLLKPESTVSSQPSQTGRVAKLPAGIDTHGGPSRLESGNAIESLDVSIAIL